jgi:hypothetical protein
VQNLTTPKAILIGLSFIAIAIASLPFTGNIVPTSNAQSGLTNVQICGAINTGEIRCLGLGTKKLDGSEALPVYTP